MSDEQQRKSGCSWPQLIVGGVAVIIVIGALIPTFNPVAKQANQAATAGNCRQIIAALKLYAGDHDGKYPDAHEAGPQTSNEAFRFLIREGVLDDERVFGARISPFVPDNVIGDPPNFPKALERGENHWAMTKGVTDASNALMPLVFEHPVSAGWPPAWNCDASGKKETGRTWRGGKIIVGLNDSSVQTIKLESDKGASVLPLREADGKDIFTRAAASMEILDILE